MYKHSLGSNDLDKLVKYSKLTVENPYTVTL